MRPCSLLEIISNEMGLALCSRMTCQLWGSGGISGHQRPQMNELQPLDYRHGDNYSNLLILCRGLILRLCTSNHNCYSMKDGESFPVDVGRPRNSQSPDSGHLKSHRRHSRSQVQAAFTVESDRAGEHGRQIQQSNCFSGQFSLKHIVPFQKHSQLLVQAS